MRRRLAFNQMMIIRFGASTSLQINLTGAIQICIASPAMGIDEDEDGDGDGDR